MASSSYSVQHSLKAIVDRSQFLFGKQGMDVFQSTADRIKEQARYQLAETTKRSRRDDAVILLAKHGLLKWQAKMSTVG